MSVVTFKISKKDGPSVEVSRNWPDNLDDPRWADTVMKPEEDIHELALQALTVKCQAGARNRLDKGEAAVQAYVESYKYGARTGGFTAPSISSEDASEQAFTDEQLAFLRAAGMVVPTEESNEE